MGIPAENAWVEASAESTVAGSSGSGYRRFKKASLAVGAVGRFNIADILHNPTIIPKEDLVDVKTIGKGAFGTVHKCVWTKKPHGDQVVAVKRMHPKLIFEPKEVTSFLEECELMNKLNHRYIVRYWGGGMDLEAMQEGTVPKAHPEQMYCVQEYCDGGNLRDMVEKQMGSLSFSLKVYTMMDALEWSIQMADALSFMHSAIKNDEPIMHRDLKLDNILLSTPRSDLPVEDEYSKYRKQKSIAKLADFGLSKRVEQAHDKGRSSYQHFDENAVMPLRLSAGSEVVLSGRLSSVTSRISSVVRHPSTLLGAVQAPPKGRRELTPKTGSFTYMAPEVFKGEQYTTKIDIFSLGVIVFELFSGLTVAARLMIAGDPMEFEHFAMRTAQNGERIPIPSSVPRPVAKAIESFWHQNPLVRPTADEAVQMLERLRPIIAQKQGEVQQANGWRLCRNA